MKILHVIPSVAPTRGGPSQAVLQMVCALNKQGIAAEIATTNDNSDVLLEVPLHRLVDYNDCPVRFFPRFSPSISVIREFAYSSGFTTWLWKSICNYDLIHVHAIFSYVSTVTMAIARFKHVPYIIRPLGQLCHWSLQQSQRKKQLYLGCIERANLNQAKAIHFTSSNERYEAQKLALKAPAMILPHGLTVTPTIPDAPFQLRQWLHLTDDEPIVLFLSRIHHKKGLEFLINALVRLVNQRFTFVIAGSGEASYETSLCHLTSRLGLGDRVRFIGFVSGHEKALLLQGSTVFALTSHSENFGVVVLESLASGLPCIITPGVALANVVSKEKLGWITGLDEEAIAYAIGEALTQEEKLKEMGNRARKFILQNYTWNQIADKLIQVYQSIIENEPIPKFEDPTCVKN